MPPALHPASSHPAVAGIPIVMGGTNFGWTLNRDQSFAILDAFYEAGGRMIDTAEGYSNWAPGNTGGESETIIGEWQRSRGIRDTLKIASKVNMEGSAGGLADARIRASLTASLDRLQTDFIDLYYAHRDDAETPQSEVAQSFGRLVESGSIRSIGASNFSAERIESAIAVAQELTVPPYSAMQDEYNLVDRRHYEDDLLRPAERSGLIAFPYYGLASGYLTGKYRVAEDFDRHDRGTLARRYHDRRGQEVLAALDRIKRETGASLASIALAWLISRPCVAAPITSASSVDQLEQILPAATLTLSREHLAWLEAPYS